VLVLQVLAQEPATVQAHPSVWEGKLRVCRLQGRRLLVDIWQGLQVLTSLVSGLSADAQMV
jgi:hypothetical protein